MYVVTKGASCADDAMLVARSPAALQLHLGANMRAGKAFGFELNASKTIVLRIGSEAHVPGPGGSPIACKGRAVHPG
eukprot:4490138-Pyramimonas_sp.AAC.1